MKPIRASEVGAYVYCRRAWWYRQKGFRPTNTEELAAGTQLHHQHGRRVLAAGFLRALAWFCLLAACAVLAVWLAGWLIG